MVDRCVCHGVTFAALRTLSERTGAGLEALSRLTGCGSGCGRCAVYIEQMLRTGRTRFEVIVGSELERSGPEGCGAAECGAVARPGGAVG